MLVQDNLNPYTGAVFYQHLPAAQARALAARFEGHYTPKNASWLHMVELELSAIARQCLHQRIPTQDELSAHVDTWPSATPAEPPSTGNSSSIRPVRNSRAIIKSFVQIIPLTKH